MQNFCKGYSVFGVLISVHNQKPMKNPRTLLLLLEPRDGKNNKELTLYYGTATEMARISKDHRSVPGNSTHILKVLGPELNLRAIDVAWGVEYETLPGAEEGRGGLQTLLHHAILLGAKNHQAILETTQPRVRKSSALD